MAELSGHLAGACSGRRAEAFDLHISDSGRIPLKEQAGSKPVITQFSPLPRHSLVMRQISAVRESFLDLLRETVVFVLINGTAISSFTSDKDSIYENKPAYNVKISIAGVLV